MPSTDRAVMIPGRRRAAGVAAIALMLGGFGLTGCGVVTTVNKVRHDVASNKATIDAFTSKLKSSESTTFEATYVTTGSSPSTTVYAVKPPKGLALKSTPTGGSDTSSLDLIVNASGEYSCSPPSSAGSGSSSRWSCQKLGTANAAVQNKILSFYTPSHWIAFLKGFSLAAGFAGDKVSSSSMTVNGFSMQCVDFKATGIAGTSTICTTAQGILGYVKVASAAARFEITAYSAAPPAALFELPPGARLTTAKTGNS
jgi:hypothetical protein